MPDALDQVQEMSERQLANALEHHRRTAPPPSVGLTHCEVLDCGEPIDPARTRLGGRLCVDCQREADIRARQYAPGRGG